MIKLGVVGAVLFGGCVSSCRRYMNFFCFNAFLKRGTEEVNLVIIIYKNNRNMQ